MGEPAGLEVADGQFDHGVGPVVGLEFSLADTGEVLHTRMQGGNAGAARGAGSFVREIISRIRGAGARGALTFRADSASTRARS